MYNLVIDLFRNYSYELIVENIDLKLQQKKIGWKHTILYVHCVLWFFCDLLWFFKDLAKINKKEKDKTIFKNAYNRVKKVRWAVLKVEKGVLPGFEV